MQYIWVGTFRVGGSKIRKTCSILESNSAFESSQIVWCNRKKHSAKVYGNQRKLEWSQTRIATLFFKRKSPFFPKKKGLKCLVCTLDRREEICAIAWSHAILVLIHDIPQVFDGVEIRRLCGPGERSHVLLLKSTPCQVVRRAIVHSNNCTVPCVGSSKDHYAWSWQLRKQPRSQ